MIPRDLEWLNARAPGTVHVFILDAPRLQPASVIRCLMEVRLKGRLSRGQAAEMLGLGFHETEALLKRSRANQQPTWEDLERSSQAIRSLLDS